MKVLACLFLLGALAPSPLRAQVDDDLQARISPEVLAVRKAGPAVVYIETDVRVPVGYDFLGRLREQNAVSSGSGAVIFEEGYIVTNFHVVKGAQKIRVQFDPTYDQRQYSAVLVSEVRSEDLALLKIEGEGPFPVVEMGTSSDLMIGEHVIAIGNPYGQTHTVSAGIISGLHREIDVEELHFNNLIQTDASINPGNSGGPLLNIHGQMIGINSAMNFKAENIGFAIPVDRVKQVLEDQLLSTQLAHAWLGFELEAPVLAVRKIVPGGPAQLAGLLPGDVLVGLDGKSFETIEQYSLLRLPLRPGTSVAVDFLRQGKRQSTSLKSWDRLDGLLYERLGMLVESIAVSQTAFRTVKRVRVTSVRPDGPASQLGLKPGDILDGLRAGNRRAVTVSDPQEMLLLISKLQAGAKLEVDVWRDEDGDGKLEHEVDYSELLSGSLVLQ